MPQPPSTRWCGQPSSTALSCARSPNGASVWSEWSTTISPSTASWWIGDTSQNCHRALSTGVPPRRRVRSMGIRDIELTTIDGAPGSMADYAGKVVMVVNVASKCGLTPQYEKLEQLQKQYEDRGFTVLGFPCNQFMGQEPGTDEEIKEFCSTTYGVTFPL